MKRKIFITSIAVAVLALMVISCGKGSAAAPPSPPRAAIVDQLYLLEPNPLFIEKTVGMLESSGFEVDVWQGEEITVKFYRELAGYGYRLIMFRAHVGVLFLVGESEVIPVEITCMFTGEPYTTGKYTAEQLTGRVYEGYMIEGYPPVFAISPGFIADSVKEGFDDAVIIMMGCSSSYLGDMAEAFIEKGASAYLGWSATVTLDYVDNATLNLVEGLLTDNLTIEQAASRTMTDLGRDPYYGARLLYSPAGSGSRTVKELIE